MLAEMMAGSNVCAPDEMVDQFAVQQQHFIGGMGIGGMGMDVDGMGVGVDPLEMEMDIGMGYMNPTQHSSQPQQQQNASSTAPPPQTTGISPQLVMLDSMPIHTHDQSQQISLFDDEASPIDAAYAEYAAATAAAKESYVMQRGGGGGVGMVSDDEHDPRDPSSNLEGAVSITSPLTQQRLEQHQQEEQRKAAQPEVTGVVQEWQRQGREYDSADSDSESEASDEDDDDDYVEEGEGRQGSEVEEAKEAASSEALGDRQVGTKRGRKTSGAKGALFSFSSSVVF